MSATNDPLPCTGEGCVIASCCGLHDKFQESAEGDACMDPPPQEFGKCPAYEPNQWTLDRIAAQYGGAER
jgi:hypothetical protein